jgi:hypothetical protein
MGDTLVPAVIASAFGETIMPRLFVTIIALFTLSPSPSLHAQATASTAHTADLLAALARNPHFTPADQQALFTAVEQRLHTAGRIYT